MSDTKNTSGHAESMPSNKGGTVDKSMWNVDMSKDNNDSMPSNDKGKVESCTYSYPKGNG